MQRPVSEMPIPNRLVALLVTALAAALVAAAPAAAQQGPPEDAIAKVAAGLCKAERQKLGDRAYTAKYGSDAACAAAQRDKAEELAQAAIDACRQGGAQPGSADFKACVQEQMKKLVGGGGQGSGGNAEAAAKLAGNIADGLCKAEAKKLGAEKFADKYGSHAKCKEALASKAEALAKEAAAKCKDAEDKQACTKDFMQSQVKADAAGAGEKLAGTLADNLCKAEAKKLGAEKFGEKYGSHAKCKEAQREKAEGLAKEAAAKCKDADDKQACTKSLLESKLKSGAKSGAPAELTDRVADGLCKAEQKKLGDEKFKAKHGDAAGCREAMGSKAKAMADEIAAACKDADDKKACLKAEVEKRFKAGKGK